MTDATDHVVAFLQQNGRTFRRDPVTRKLLPLYRNAAVFITASREPAPYGHYGRKDPQSWWHAEWDRIWKYK